MRRRARRALAAVTAAVLAGMAIVVTPGGAAPASRRVPVAASAYEEGFRIESRTTYAFDPAAEVVHVALDLTMTNQKPDQRSGSYIQYFYLPSYGVPVLSEATNLRATEGGATLPVTLEGTESPRFKVAVIDLQPDLRYGQVQTVHVTYDLPKVPPRGEGFTRLNKAYATFPTLALGDPALASVEIHIPSGWEVELVGNDMERAERNGQQVYTAEAIPDPFAWEVLVSARDDSELIERTVDVGEDGVKVLGWPDDPEWADFAEQQVTDGVPVLEDLIGIDWPATTTIEVVETASPYLYGYAGWYMPFESVIEVGDELNDHVMLHELAHLWFNDDLFEGRWINEAFADALAAAAVGKLGGDVPTPKAIAADDPGELKLNDWSNPDLQAGVSDDQERYGYNTSWAVMHAIIDEIGLEKLAEVIGAADAGLVAYRGPGVPEEVSRTFDWKELLDLLEEVGGSAKAATLFEDVVVGESDAAAFVARAAARERYAALLEAGDGWAPPTSIRLAMTDWRFPTAEDLMTTATEILETKAELLELTADLDVADDLALQDTYEAGKELEDVADVAADALATAEILGEAEDSVADGAGPIGAVGLLFNGADDELADAQEAFDDGDYAAARSAAADAEDVVDGAVLVALLRLLALVFVVAVAWFVRKRLKARRRRKAERAALDAMPTLFGSVLPPPDAAPSEVPAAVGPLEADGAEGVGGPPDGGSEVGV
jgi:hypothetical protein